MSDSCLFHSQAISFIWIFSPQLSCSLKFCQIQFQLPHASLPHHQPRRHLTSSDNPSTFCLFEEPNHIPHSITLFKSYWSTYVETHSGKRKCFGYFCVPSLTPPTPLPRPNLAAVRYRMRFDPDITRCQAVGGVPLDAHWTQWERRVSSLQGFSCLFCWGSGGRWKFGARAASLEIISEKWTVTRCFSFSTTLSKTPL